MNAVELRKKFMDEAAEDLLQQYIDVIQHKDTFNSTDPKAREEMWSLLKHAIMSTKDAEKQDFQNTNDIIKMVAKGTISAKEGKEYIELLKLKKAADILPDNSESGLSFAIDSEDDPAVEDWEPNDALQDFQKGKKSVIISSPDFSEDDEGTPSDIWETMPDDYLDG